MKIGSTDPFLGIGVELPQSGPQPATQTRSPASRNKRLKLKILEAKNRQNQVSREATLGLMPAHLANRTDNLLGQEGAFAAMMSGKTFLDPRRIVRDMVLGLAFFTALATVAVADRAQSGRGLIPITAPAATAGPASDFSRNPSAVIEKSAPGATAMVVETPPKKVNSANGWLSTEMRGPEKMSSYEILMPLGLLFALAFAFTAALVRHVLQTYALEPARVRPSRSNRRLQP